MSIRLSGRWNSELLNLHLQQSQPNSRNDQSNNLGRVINLKHALNGRNIKDISLGVYHMLILTDQDDILVAGTSLPINEKSFQLVQIQDPKNESNIYFPIYKFTPSLSSSQTLFQSPQIACGPEFCIFTQSVKEGKNYRHYLNLFGWDSKKVFDSRRNTTRNSLTDILQGLLLKNMITEEIPTTCEGDTISQIVCGGDFWMIVMNRKKIFGKGYNRDGVLGLGHKNDCKKITILPSQDMFQCEYDTIKKVSCGLHHAIFVISNLLNSSIQVFTSGDNRFGQLAHNNSKFQTKFSKSESLTNLIQTNGFRDVCCEYQSTWLLTSNNKLFACGLLSYSSTNQSVLRKVLVPIEFKVPYSSSLLSNGLSPKTSFHFGCGGFHSVFSNHRSDSIVGIGTNTCEQLFPHQSTTIQEHQKNTPPSTVGMTVAVSKLTSMQQENSPEKMILKKILCSRDCSFMVFEPLPAIQGLHEYLIKSNRKLSDVVLITSSC